MTYYDDNDVSQHHRHLAVSNELLFNDCHRQVGGSGRHGTGALKTPLISEYATSQFRDVMM